MRTKIPASTLAFALVLGLGCAHRGGAPPGSGAAERPSGPPELIPASVAPPLPAWSETVDFRALREAYGARRDFPERCEDREATEAFVKAVDEDRLRDAVAAGASALERCPVWPQLHLWHSAALRRLGREAEADVHRRWYVGLIRSVLESGDGLSPETAFETISIGEEYAVLGALGLEKRTQTLIQSPTMLDALRVVDESGAEKTLYFNPSWHFVRLLDQFSDP